MSGWGEGDAREGFEREREGLEEGEGENDWERDIFWGRGSEGEKDSERYIEGGERDWSREGESKEKIEREGEERDDKTCAFNEMWVRRKRMYAFRRERECVSWFSKEKGAKV